MARICQILTSVNTSHEAVNARSFVYHSTVLYSSPYRINSLGNCFLFLLPSCSSIVGYSEKLKVRNFFRGTENCYYFLISFLTNLNLLFCEDHVLLRHCLENGGEENLVISWNKFKTFVRWELGKLQIRCIFLPNFLD